MGLPHDEPDEIIMIETDRDGDDDTDGEEVDIEGFRDELVEGMSPGTVNM